MLNLRNHPASGAEELERLVIAAEVRALDGILAAFSGYVMQFRKS